MKDSRVFLIGICCAIGGLALGFGWGRHDKGATQAPQDAARRQAKLASATARGTIGDETQRVRDREFLEKWVAAECPENEKNAAFECLWRWAWADANAALHFVENAPRFSDRNLAYVTALAALGKTDMPRVIEFLRQNIPAQERPWLADRIIEQLAKVAPKQAALLALADDISVASYCWDNLMPSLVKLNPTEAVAVLEAAPESKKLYVAISLIRAWAKENPNAAVDWYASQRAISQPHDEEIVTGWLLREVAMSHPQQLSAVIDRLGVDCSNSRLGMAISDVIGSDPLAAFDVIKKLPPENRGFYAGPLVEALFKTDPDQAVATARLLLSEQSQAAQIYRAWELWQRSDGKAAFAWLDAQGDAALGSQIKTMYAATNDPAAYLAVADLSDNDPFQRRCINTAADMLGLRDPRALVDWLVKHPDQITDERVSRMATLNPISGSTITMEDINAVPAGPGREILLKQKSREWARNKEWDKIADALPLAQDPGQQEIMRFQVFSGLMRDSKNKEAARQWLDTQPVSDEVRTSWEALIRNGLQTERLILF